MIFFWAAGLARYFTNAQAASGCLRALETTAPVGLTDVAWPAGPFGSGAIPRSIPAAWWVGTSHEPFDLHGRLALLERVAGFGEDEPGRA